MIRHLLLLVLAGQASLCAQTTDKTFYPAKESVLADRDNQARLSLQAYMECARANPSPEPTASSETCTASRNELHNSNFLYIVGCKRGLPNTAALARALKPQQLRDLAKGHRRPGRIAGFAFSSGK